MAGDIVIRVEGLWKEYRLGAINHGTLKADLSSWWARMRGRDDPNMKLDTGESTDNSDESSDRFWALRDVNFEVRQGEVLGIIGGNGAGKSTLLKILSRVTTPTKGVISAKGRVASLLEVGTGFHPDLTGRENVFLNGAILGMRRNEIASKFDEIVAFAGVEKFIDTPVKRYSSGMYVRLAFAVAAHLEPDILVIDEVLAVGDTEFQKRCLGKMDEVTKAGRTILFVSHNMIAVQRLCSRSLWMKGGRSIACGPSEDLIPRYIKQQTSSAVRAQSTPGVLFEVDESPQLGEIYVERVELKNKSGRIKEEVATWDYLSLVINFRSLRRFVSMSVVIQVATTDGSVLILTSTTPDRSTPFSVDYGRYQVECSFPSFPLAAGEYILGVGLAIPGVEYVWRRDDLCRFEVLSKDVYQSGLAPSANRYLVAANHEWSAVRNLTTDGPREYSRV